MPHVNSGGGDDLYSSDEVKVYKDEGGEEEEKQSSENLSEEKLGLVTETEEDKGTDLHGNGYGSGDKTSGGSQGGKSDGSQDHPIPPFSGYPLFPSFPYTNGATLPGLGKLQPPHLSPLMYDHLGSPPPAHMGIPPVHIDPKTGLPRPPMYPLPPPPGQFHPLYGPDAMQWTTPPGYAITAAGFRSSYPSPLNSAQLARFSPGSMIPSPHNMGFGHPAIITPGIRQDIPSPIGNENHRPVEPPKKQKPYVKKPLNAFMLFMKEQRQKIIEEGSLKESAAINQILGRKWHALDRSEQSKYYEMARKEKELHMQLYPGWSARDNYASHAKRKVKRKRGGNSVNYDFNDSMNKGPMTPDKNASGFSDYDCPNAKKCRARYGVDAQSQWCKPCRRKKKCERYHGDDDDDQYPNNLSVATVDSTTTDGETSELGSPARPLRPTSKPSSSVHSSGLAADSTASTVISSHSHGIPFATSSLTSTPPPPFSLYRPSAFHPLPQRHRDFNHNHPGLPLSPASSTSARSEDGRKVSDRPRTPDTPSRKPFIPSASTPILAT